MSNMPFFILVNYLFLHSCLLENLAFSPEIVWLCEMVSKSLCICKSVHYIDINYNSANSEAQKEKVKRIWTRSKCDVVRTCATTRPGTDLHREAIHTLGTWRWWQGRATCLLWLWQWKWSAGWETLWHWKWSAGWEILWHWKWSSGWETLSISTRTWTTSGTQDKQAESVCRWVRPPEGDQITPPFCKVDDEDVDKMLILVMADSLKMLGTSPFLMSLVATKNLPASSLSSTLKMSLP